MNLVIGATGLLGGQICRLLSSHQQPVRAMVRPTADASRLEELRQFGAEMVHGDLKDAASLTAACAGATAVFSTASSTFSRQPGDSIEAVDRQGQLRLVEAAKAAGVKHFIYISFSPMPEDFTLQRVKREVEAAVMASGMTYTILRPTFFMEVWWSAAVGFDVANRKARIYGTGESPISWISFTNVGEFAFRSLENPAARNATLLLGGPEALSQLEVVRIFEELGGGHFTLEPILESVLQGAKAAAKRPLDEAFAALGLACAHGDVIDMRATLAAIPIHLISVREYATWFLNDARSTET